MNDASKPPWAVKPARLPRGAWPRGLSWALSRAMFRAGALLLAAGLIGATFSACPRSLRPQRVSPERAGGFQRGVALGLFATDAAYDYAPLLDEIVDHGATDVLIAVAWYQSDRFSHDIAARPGFSPSRETLGRTLAQARARGLRVLLLPIVRLRARAPDEWRGRIEPRAGVDAWFARYRAFVRELAEAAAAAGVERFSVGSELLSLERYEAHWRELIRDVRAVFPGDLLYSANWDHFEPVAFWDALDEVGVTAYFALAPDEARPRSRDLVRAWWPARLALARMQARTGKPLVITEVGYPSHALAARYPWDETRRASPDPALQAELYAAFCAAFADEAWLSGYYFWNWFGFGGLDDPSYTPRGKPAALEMRRCLSRDPP